MNLRTGPARFFWAVLIALSVALLPATIGATPKLASTDMSSMSMDSMAMDDCCPEPCDTTMNDCPFMASCILKSFNFAAQDFSRLVLPLTQMAAMPFKLSDSVVSQSGSPPLHPPQN